MRPRDYQISAMEMLFKHFHEYPNSRPVLEMPTGSGKSIVTAMICEKWLSLRPSDTILVLSDSQEIVEQDYQKLLVLLPNINIGAFSAGLGIKRIGQVTVASIKSIFNVRHQIPKPQLVLVDECHMVDGKPKGQYREIMHEFDEARITGLTATPYRLGQGYLDEGDNALFTDILKGVAYMDLIDQKYLVPHKSKFMGKQTIDVNGIKKVRGEFAAGELAARLNDPSFNSKVFETIQEKANEFNCWNWLFFCAGVEHAQNMADILNEKGILAECIHAKTPKKIRRAAIEKARQGELVLTNDSTLIKGVDIPCINLIADLQPTMSVAKYVQRAGRGARPYDGKDFCLYLDFAGNVGRHGSIINPLVLAPAKGQPKEAPVKACPECGEFIHLSYLKCPECSHEFPKPEPKVTTRLHKEHDIMGGSAEEHHYPIMDWLWEEHVSHRTGKLCLKVTYFSRDGDFPLTEYFMLMHEGYARKESIQRIGEIFHKSNLPMEGEKTLEQLAQHLNDYGKCPSEAKWRQDGRFRKVIGKVWQ